MPRKLTSDPNAVHPFWYKPNVAPPKDWNKWDQLIEAFARHLVERYGEDEVANWYFEVWNEPNIDFWAGAPKEATYYDLYDHTARAIKRVSARLRLGGPATAQAAWPTVFWPTVKRRMFRSISSPRTSTEMTKQKTSSARTKIFRAMKWCAAR